MANTVGRSLAGGSCSLCSQTIFATGLGSVERDDSSVDFMAPGSQSSQVLRLVESAQAASGSKVTTAAIVVYRDGVPLTAADQAQIDAVREGVAAGTAGRGERDKPWEATRPGALRVEVVGQLADAFAAVGEEGDLLVGLHPLGGKHVEQPPFGLLS